MKVRGGVVVGFGLDGVDAGVVVLVLRGAQSPRPPRPRTPPRGCS